MDLSPAHLLILLVVAVVLTGPKRLPEVAHQLGGAWRRLRDFRDRVESEIRSNVPDLPSNQDLARFARSPVAFLDQLASTPTDRDAPVLDPAAPTPPPATNGAAHPPDEATGDATGSRPVPPLRRGRTAPVPLQPADDPSMN